MDTISSPTEHTASLLSSHSSVIIFAADGFSMSPLYSLPSVPVTIRIYFRILAGDGDMRTAEDFARR
jgi:hypothetical protein